MGSGTAASLIFDSRPIQLTGAAGTATIANNNASALISIAKPLGFSGVTGNKILQLGGSNTGANTFAGNIANPSGYTTSLIKADGGNWKISGNMSHTGGITMGAGTLTLSGTNTYSGQTIFSGGGPALVIAGTQALSPNTSLLMNNNASTAASTVTLLDDGSGTITLPNTFTIEGANAPGNTHTFIVGNNNTANGGTSSGTTLGSTIAVATFNFGSMAGVTSAIGQIPIQGYNGYRLQFNNVILANANAQGVGVNTTTTFTPTTANVTFGTVTMATGNALKGVPFLVLDGTSSDNRITGVISDATDALTTGRPLNLTKSSSSTWTLSGSNTYSGVTSINGGTLVVDAIANVSGGASPLGAPTSVTNGTIAFNGGTLRYTGSGHTSDRVMNLAGSGALNASGPGALVLTSPLTATAAGAKTLTLNGSSTATNTLSGAIVNGSGTTGVTKSGSCTWVLTAVNTYKGATTLAGGVLKVLDTGAGLTQTLGSLVVGGSDGTLESVYAGGGTMSTTFTSLTARVVGNTANIAYTGGTIGTDNMINLTNAAGFIDKGLFVDGANYAAMNAANTYIRALDYGVDVNTVTNDLLTASKHVKLTIPTAPQNTNTFLSMNLSGDGVGYIQNDGHMLTVPGILKAGGGTNVITGGSALTGGTGIELVVRTDTAADTLIVGTPVTGTGALTKSGAGRLVLLATNTYTGGTYVNGGTFEVGGAGQLGSGTYTKGITNNATFLYSSSLNQTLSGAISGSGALVMSGSGKLTLTSPTNTYTGATTINAGTFEIGGAGRLGSGSYAGSIINNGTLLYNSTATQTLSGAVSGGGAITQSGTGMLLITGTNTCTGKLTINAGTFSIGSAGLSAGATIEVATGAQLVLNYSGTNTISRLILNGSTVGAGVWGAANSGGLLSGPGLLNILPAGGTIMMIE